MRENNGKKKLVWIILFSIITIITCYFFIVVYFHFISPYDISLKIAFWPFSSENQIGQMYKDAVVKVSFEAYSEEAAEDVAKTAQGVNIKKDGFVLMPYSEIQNCTNEDKIKITTYSGGVYNGKILYKSREFNLALLKCENTENGNKNAITIPFVNLTSSYAKDQRVVVSSWNSSSPRGKISDDGGYSYVSPEGYFYSIEDGFLIALDATSTAFPGGAVFDKGAHLLGFSYSDTIAYDSSSSVLSEDKKHFVMPTYLAMAFVDEVIDAYKNEKAYENKYVDAFIGVDSTEARELAKVSRLEGGQISYHDKLYENSEDLQDFVSNHIDGVFLFEKFSKDEKTIPQNAIITSIVVNDEAFQIEERIDLYIILHSVEAGDVVKINYQKKNGGDYLQDSKTFAF